jgi:O-antigen ligase
LVDVGRNQVEQFLDRASGPFGIPNSLAGFLILMLPATGALTFRRQAGATERVWWAWVSLVFGLGVLLTVSRGGWIALALALVAWPLIARRWSWKRRLISALVVVGIMVGAAAMLFQTAPEIRNRFERLVRDSGELSRPILWRAAWENFRTHPVTGSGAGSYNIVFEQYRPERFVDEPQWAHNEYLNTLSDYGGIGLILLLGAAGAIAIGKRRDGVRHADAKQGWLDATVVREGLAIGSLAFAIQAFVDFHFKIPALAMTFAVVAALAMSRRTPVPTDSSTARPRAVAVGWLLASGLSQLPWCRCCDSTGLRR